MKIAFVFIPLIIRVAFAQVADKPIDLENIGTPTIISDRGTKFFEAQYSVTGGFPIRSESQIPTIADSSGQINNINEMKFSLSFPVINKKKTKIFGNIGLRHEEINFQNDEEQTYGLYTHLGDKSLNSLGIRLLYSQSLKYRKFFVLVAEGELNGNYYFKDYHWSKLTKFSAALILGREKTEYFSYGYGIYYSYTLGRPSMYPVILYYRNFSSPITIEAIFPASVTMIYAFSEKSNISGGYNLDGDSYYLELKDYSFPGFSTLELRKSMVELFLRFEKKLVNHLWFSLSSGLRKNISFNLARNNSILEGPIVKSETGIAPFFGASIFLTAE